MHQLFKDDKGQYILSAFRAKLYGKYDEATGVFTKTQGTVFGGRETIATVQGIDVKTPIINGRQSRYHVPYDFTEALPQDWDLGPEAEDGTIESNKAARLNPADR